jgi:exonuclease 3'-5' domain-containing protein 1
MDLTLCSTEEQLSRALTPILHSPYLVLDCEGRALGLQGGALSLLSIGTSRDEVFLVDVLGVPRETDAMRRLLALLGDPDVVKIMWDGRMDAVALRETYGVALAGVLDIQLAEVVSRAQARGEEDDTRLERLMFAVGRRALSTPKAYSEMHSLAGLDGCLRLFRVGLEHTKSGA